MGRRAMSPELKEARGNPGKRPIRKRVASRKAVGRALELARPAWLPAAAKTIWQKLRQGEGAIHFLRGSDVNIFTRYCIYMADWIEATKKIAKTGGAVYETSSAHVENMMRVNPWFTVRSRLEDDLVKMEEKIGLTPLDRLRIAVQLANAAQLPASDLFGTGGSSSEEADEGREGPAPASLPAEVATIGGLSRLN